MSKPRRTRRAHRQARDRPERAQDPRLVGVRIAALGGIQAAPGTWAVAVSPVRMDDGRVLNWYSPQPVAFSLVEAKRLCDRAVPKRRQVLGNLRKRENDSYGPTNARVALDCLSDLAAAVLFAFTAIESLANHSIDQLDDDATVTIERAEGPLEITKDDMVRRLGIGEKLTLVVPMLPDGANFKGTEPWERYRHLKRLRDDLVHVKQRGYDPDPDVRTAYDRVMLGDADTCWQEARDVVLAARPGFLPDHVLQVLS
jgi:hypothetical protein